MAIYTFLDKKYVVAEEAIDLLDQVLAMAYLLDYKVNNGVDKGLSISFIKEGRQASLQVNKWFAKVFFIEKYTITEAISGGTHNPWDKPFKELVEWF